MAWFKLQLPDSRREQSDGSYLQAFIRRDGKGRRTCFLQTVLSKTHDARNWGIEQEPERGALLLCRAQIFNEPNSSLLSLALSYLSFAMIIVTTVSLVLDSLMHQPPGTDPVVGHRDVKVYAATQEGFQRY